MAVWFVRITNHQVIPRIMHDTEKQLLGFVTTPEHPATNDCLAALFATILGFL